jgi:hypothetical protein
LVEVKTNKNMEKITAGIFYSDQESSIREMAKKSVTYLEGDMNYAIDSKWLREKEAESEAESELEENDDTVLIRTLDYSRLFDGWRDVDLLYVWPA